MDAPFLMEINKVNRKQSGSKEEEDNYAFTDMRTQKLRISILRSEITNLQHFDLQISNQAQWKLQSKV